MKRKLSLLLAVVMMISLVPMSAFASSDNRVLNVQTVSEDDTFTTVSGAPKLRIEEESKNEFGGADFDFYLDIENAEWNDEMFDATVNEAVYAVGAKGDANAVYMTFAKRTATSVKATVNFAGTYKTATPARGTELVFDVPMLVELDGEGDAKVKVSSPNGLISSGTYTFAVGQEGSTTVTVGSSKTLTRKGSNAGATFIIDETVKGSLSEDETQGFTAKLPKEYTWNTNTTIVFDRNLVNAGISNVKVNGLAAGDTGAIHTYSASTGTITLTDESDLNSGRDLKVNFEIANPTTQRGAISVSPVIAVSKDAKYGEVKVTLNGYNDVSNASDILVAKYKDYGVTVELDEEEVKEFVAGRVDDEYVTAKVIIEENIAGSLLQGRAIDFELPDWVSLQDKTTINDIFTTVKYANVAAETFGDDAHEFSIDVDRTSNTDKVKYELEIPLTIKADKAGDVELTIKGAGIEETTLVVAKAVAPLTVEVKVADVKIGLQKQAAPEIIIKENFPGALLAGKDKVLSLQMKDQSFGMRFDDATVEVIDGDLDINVDDSGVEDIKNSSGDVTMDNGSIDILVEGESSKASTIKVSGIQLTLDRNVPEGPFQLDVKGNAVVENGGYEDFATRVARFEFANVVTKAGGEVASTSKFVIGSTTYKVLVGKVEVEKTMDVAPFIADGRTMLPIRYVAEALGVATDNIIWNNEARTVTIMKGDRIAMMTIDSNVLTVNGTAIPMDTKAMIKDGRTVLPVRYAAQALGAEILWDAATQTVTVNQ